MPNFYSNLVYLHWIIFCCSFVLVFGFANSVYFHKSNFDLNDKQILYQGDAEAKPSGVIEFNNLDHRYRVGWATYADKVPLWNSKTGELSDFSTRFAFTITMSNASSYGHGFAFFLAPVGSEIPPNSAGALLGLFNTTDNVSALGQAVLVEFDTYKNSWDPVGVNNHVGININSLTSANYTSWNASFHKGDTADVLISYNATTKNFRASWTYQTTNNPQETSSLSYHTDLTKVLPEWVMVGFSGSIGLAKEQHILQSWEFNSTLVRRETKGSTARKTTIVISVVVPVVGFMVVTVITYIMFRKRKRKTEERTNLTTSMDDDLGRGAGPRRFSYLELAYATNNFSEQRKLGEGGFGTVYRGYLPDLDLLVAVKRISKGSKQGKKEYVTEVKTISQLRHRNLVQLIGWCHDQREFLLIYEFMPNGSLDSHLFGKRAPLSWPMRHKISLGLASAILYLHEEWEQCVVHRDIKSSNVMLDASFNVKLGDFGLARLMDHDLGPRTTGLAGTFGYMAPEYISSGKASKESDIFSFGVVLLEIATGKTSVDLSKKSEMGLVEWVWDVYGKGELLAVVDNKLNKDVVEKQVECLMVVGLWCSHPDSNSRPSIKQAIHALNFEAEMPNLPTKMPVPMYHVPTTSSATSAEPLLTNSSLETGR
ncbi:L-type lectin-domain containing receptor kinase IX.1 isoform X1 [Gossypium raimondii]|uniref:Protein kinase domain-containing protein n=3 Tax=Gossypium raimondii TaxID=29730 RepID=A0A0D2USB2_GOSRA|nr:L-type lectin-domain containing receptor kinase IX.1 isoform X1 [Gossypium raimondii]KJB71191.1 hypothetical protein B456_011G109300 [Gossypium raimondii]